MIGLTAYIECCVKFSIFEVTQQDWRALHVLAMCDGCFEAMEEQSLLNLLESKNYFQNDQATQREESSWSDQQHWITIAGGSNSITSDLRSGLRLHPPSPQPASFIGLVGKERCRVPHYQNLESGSDTQGITSKQSKCGDWIILIFGPGEKDLKYISFAYIFSCLFNHFPDGPEWLITMRSK